jgi:Flp pilus assembly protein TadB
MDKALLIKIILIITAALIAMIIYFVAGSINFEKSARKRVKDMVEKPNESIFDVGGTKISGRFSGNVFTPFKRTLYWAQIGGSYRGWTVGGMFIRGIAFALAISLFNLALGLPVIAWFIALFSVMMPYLLVKGKAEEVRKNVKRLLPETATVIAAEMDAGATASQAIERAGELPGPLGAVLSEAVSKARQSERAMFSRGANQGVLMEELNQHGMAELSRFAMQLDRIAAKGVDAPRVMIEIAKGLAREYKSMVQAASTNMDVELLIPMSVFFFFPFLAALMIPILLSLLEVFSV